jgi:hypothetical protein
MGHHLNLSIEPTITCSTFKVADSSIYLDNQPIQNCILEITPPLANCPIVFNFTKGFTLIANVSNLKIVQVDHFENYSLPDGPYQIKYSINPNSKLFIETIYFRTCKIDNILNLKILELFKNKCNITKSEFEKRELELIKYKFQIEAAKSFAELEKDFERSSKLYNDTLTSLKSIDTCSTC